MNKEGEELKGPGTVGNFHLKNWAIIVLNAILKKTENLSNQWNDISFNSKELLIEADITPMIGAGHPQAISLLKDFYKKESVKYITHFDKTHIFSQNRIVIDALGQTNILHFTKDDILRLSQNFQNT